ncbi:transcriptional regulator domain-containing protein [Hyphomicrobium sp.]|uniref:transcriptional regulator domain-containing protein n=1 Tax=Hyphomicrobium sp. TaxID=82 RepID=UPI002FE0C683
MLSIDWRAPAAYRHTKHLPAAGFAWEYLRRNDEYRHEYQTLTAMQRPDARQLEAFALRWGLRFRRRSRRAA